MDKSLSLDIWKDNIGNSVNLVTERNRSPSLERSKLVKPVYTISAKYIKNNGKRQPFTDSAKDVLVEEMIHELNIENCICIILAKTHNVVQDCKGMTISFRESEDEVVSSIVGILQNKDYMPHGALER